MLLRQCTYRRHIGWLPIQMHRDDGFCSRSDLLLDPLDIDIECRGIDVHEDHLGTCHPNGFGRGDEAVRDRNDLVAWPDAERPQRDEQRIRAIREADAMRNPAILCECLLERLYEWTSDEGGIRDDRGDGGVDVGLDRLVLCFQIDKRDRERRTECVHRVPLLGVSWRSYGRL